MNIVERISISLRRNTPLMRADWLWDRLRPTYNRLIANLGRKGLRRTINGTDSLLVLPRFRGVAESYEPNFWTQMMAEVQPGSIVVDVGAYIGLYTVAIAKRLGPSGKVIAFEPDPDSFASLKAHVELNQVAGRVELVQAAATTENGTVPFESGRHSSMSRIAGEEAQGTYRVKAVRLDTILAESRVDILKIDVEGFEEQVVRGASGILGNRELAPPTIFIEVHPYAWKEVGVTSQSLLRLLREAGYEVFDLLGQPVETLREYGQIVARRHGDLRRTHPRQAS
jgi:FkbM family methyltransferase